LPRARKEGLLVRELDDELLVYDRTRHRAHCLNQTAALVWRRCDGSTSVSQIARLLRMETNSEVDEAVVSIACDQLARAHLLQSKTRKWSAQSGISRRELVLRMGTAAAIALPVVSSIVAPEAVQAATCLGSGQVCSTGPQCCSFVCSGGMCA